MRRRNKYVSTFWGGPKPPQKEVFQTIYFGALSCLKNFCRGAAKSHTVETKTNGKKYLSFLSHAAFHAEPVQQRLPARKPVHVFAGIAHCECGEKMYVQSKTPKYVCQKCLNKIAIVDLEGIFCDEIQSFSFSSERIKAHLN